MTIGVMAATGTVMGMAADKRWQLMSQLIIVATHGAAAFGRPLYP